MAPSLEQDVCWSTSKNHLGNEYVRRLMLHSHEQVLNTLEAMDDVIGGYVDTKILRSLLTRAHVGPEESDPWQLYALMTLGLWLERIAGYRHTVP